MCSEGLARGYEGHAENRLDCDYRSYLSRSPLRTQTSPCSRESLAQLLPQRALGEKRDKIEHISSHKGTASHEQKGNYTADKIANAYRKLGQDTDEVEYFTEAEERFLLKHKKILIQQDIRVFLKSLEKATMLEIWKQKAPKQAQWFVKYPQQVTKQAKQVWKWAIAAGEGQAWLYFIFAVCQWLPTNYRVHYADESGYERTRCNLCLTDSKEDLAHLLVCPALAAEQELLIRVTLEKLKDCEVPWAREAIETLETRTCRKLVQMHKEC